MRQHRPALHLAHAVAFASAVALAIGFCAPAHAQDASAAASHGHWEREQNVLVIPRAVDPNAYSESANPYSGTADDANSPYAGTADDSDSPDAGTADAGTYGPIVVNPPAPDSDAQAVANDSSSGAAQGQNPTDNGTPDNSVPALAYGAPVIVPVPMYVPVPAAPYATFPPTRYSGYQGYPYIRTPYVYGAATSPYRVNNLRPTYTPFAPAPLAYGAPGAWGPRQSFGAPMASHPFFGRMAAPAGVTVFRGR